MVENLDMIESLLREILKDRFPGSRKQELYDKGSNFSFACPFCGDSVSNDTKKRGTIYKDTLIYKCYNCGLTAHASHLLKYENVKNLPSYSLSLVRALTKSNSPDEVNEYTMSEDEDIFLWKLEDVLKQTNIHNISQLTPKDKEIYDYVIGRRRLDLIHPSHTNEVYIMSGDEPRLIFLNFSSPDKDSIIGLKSRLISPKKNTPRSEEFKLIHYEKIVSASGKVFDNASVVCNNLNKLSRNFNILTLDYSKKVYTLEGEIDSLFLNNSVAMGGVNNDVSILEKFASKENIRILFDNDEVGNSTMRDLVKKGYMCFCWNKWIEKYGNELTERVKDVNDAVKIFGKRDLDFDNDIFYTSNLLSFSI